MAVGQGITAGALRAGAVYDSRRRADMYRNLRPGDPPCAHFCAGLRYRSGCRRRALALCLAPAIWKVGTARRDPVSSYYEDARSRARRRRSPWNLLLLLVTVLATGAAWWLLFRAVALVQRAVAPAKVFGVNMSHPGEILMVVPPFFPAVAIGMLLANAILWCISPARRALERESKGFPGTDFAAAMKQVGLAGLVLLAIAIPLSILGAIDPW